MAKDKEVVEPSAVDLERAEQARVQAAVDAAEAARVALLEDDE